MCILRINSESSSFKPFAVSTAVPVYSCADKGDPRVRRGAVYDRFHISFDVSDKDWDDIQGQIRDAIAFLTAWESELVALIAAHEVKDAYLDFPLYSRLGENCINQNDHLPRELIVLAGRIGLGIAMSIYDKRAFDEIDDRARSS